jgi:hypothetical protein
MRSCGRVGDGYSGASAKWRREQTIRLCQGNMVEVSQRDPVPSMTPVNGLHTGMLIHTKPHMRGLQLK